MRVLVLGGTGFIGRPLAACLLAAGHEVASLSRGETPASTNDNLTKITGDRWSLEASRAAIEGFAPDVVIDIFAMTEGRDRPVLEFFSRRTPRYLLISSCDVYRVMGRLLGTEPGPIIEGPQDEKAPLREKLYPYRDLTEHTGGDDYDKIPLEEACLNAFAFAGTVLRLPMIFGPGDRQHRFRDMIYHCTKKRPAILYPEAYARWTSTYGYIDNVAAAIACAATDERARGEIYNIGEFGGLDQKAWAEAFGTSMDWQGKVITAAPEDLPEKRAVFAAAGNLEQKLLIDASKIKRDLGFVPPVSIEEALARTITYEEASLSDIPAEAYDFAADDAFLAM